MPDSTTASADSIGVYTDDFDLTMDITECKIDRSNPLTSSSAILHEVKDSTTEFNLKRDITRTSERRAAAYEIHAPLPQVAPAPAPAKRPHSHGDGSMNTRSLILHLFGDALGNLGVIVTGLIIWLAHFGWRFRLDALASLFITVVIFVNTLPLVRRTTAVLLQCVPPDVSLGDVERSIRAVDGVAGVHELHVWQLSESVSVGSVHVRIAPGNSVFRVTKDVLRSAQDHDIQSLTVQTECLEGGAAEVRRFIILHSWMYS